MPLEHTPLDLASLTEGARKVLSGPAPLKLMAARGLAPLRPPELVAVLYQLATSSDPAEAPVRAAAEKSVGELPEKILGPALTDATLDPRILDFFAPRVASKPALVEALLLNKAVADSTVVELCPRLGEKELELVALNEQRLLREPAIIAAMYLNTKARMSTVDRALELAVRNNVTVAGIPRWDDLVQAVLGAAGKPAPPPEQVDATFNAVARVALGDEPTSLPTPSQEDDDLEVINARETEKVDEVKGEIPIDKLSTAQKIRLATIGNGYARAILIRDPLKIVAMAAISSPAVSDLEALKYSANRNLADDVIRIIANTKEWLKIYKIKVNLVNNAKTPLPLSMKILPLLYERDLRNVSRSRSIPSALVAQARKLINQKGKG